MVDFSTPFQHSNEVIQAVDPRLPEALLQQPKSPVRRKLCVTDNQEGDGDGVVKTSEDHPRQVLHHVPTCTCVHSGKVYATVYAYLFSF